MTTRDILAEILRDLNAERAAGICEMTDAILADKRIAVVELPEPKEPAPNGALWFGDFRARYSPAHEAAGLPCVMVHGPADLHRSVARKLAAALLAAANAAEVKP